jgi:hypothetical protein
MIVADELIPSLARENRIPRLLKAGKTHELYAGEYGRRARILVPLTVSLASILRQEQVAEIEMISALLKDKIDLRFLSELSDVRAVTVRAEKPIDWSPLERLLNLESLDLRFGGDAPKSIDFARFRKLRSCSINWSSEWESVLNCTSLWHLSLENLDGITSVELTALKELRELFLNRCKGLRRVQLRNEQTIESLAIANCRALEQFEPVEAFEAVRYLALSSHSRLNLTHRTLPHLRRLWLKSIGKIESLRFLSESRDLEYVQLLFSTTVQDGDFSFFERLPGMQTVRYSNRRHYSHTAEELNALFRSRRSPVG